MDDDKERLRTLLVELFTQLDFSNIYGFPNHCYEHEKLFDVAPEFCGNNGDSTTHHIVSFFKLVVDFNIYHEDDLMTTFAWTLEGGARNWLCNLDDKSITSMAKFFGCFLLRWHEGEEEEIKQLAKKYSALLPRAQPNSKKEKNREEQHVETFVHPEDLVRLEEPTFSTIEQHVLDDPIEETFEGPLIKEHIEDPPHVTLT